MKAALYQGKAKVELTDLPYPECGDSDIIVKNLYASICGTDVAVYRHGPHTGHKITVGGEFGHEMVSEVVEVGRDVQGIAVGDRVYPYPLLAKGDPKRAGTVGGFSEFVLIPNAKMNQQIYLVPDKIPSRVASLIEPFTVGTRAARRSNPRPGENAIVFGAGTIGLAAAVALKYFGCDQVMVVDVSDFRLNIADKLGFAVCNSALENLREKAISVLGEGHSIHGKTADAGIYIDAAGAEELIETYQSMGMIGSRLVVVAVRAGLRPINVLEMTYAQHALIGSGGYMPEDVLDVMNIMENGKWDINAMITDEFPWERLPQAIERASDSQHALNVVIKY